MSPVFLVRALVQSYICSVFVYPCLDFCFDDIRFFCSTLRRVAFCFVSVFFVSSIFFVGISSTFFVVSIRPDAFVPGISPPFGVGSHGGWISFSPDPISFFFAAGGALLFLPKSLSGDFIGTSKASFYWIGGRHVACFPVCDMRTYINSLKICKQKNIGTVIRACAFPYRTGELTCPQTLDQTQPRLE